MAAIRLTWQRFASFLELREAFRARPCIYLQTDPKEYILRVGQSDDLWERYKGGTAYAVEAALHGSGNLFFATDAPGDRPERRRLEATLIYDLSPPYNNQHKDFPPAHRVEYVHEGEVPRTLRGPSSNAERNT
jgi:hypothetical protein